MRMLSAVQGGALYQNNCIGKHPLKYDNDNISCATTAVPLQRNRCNCI